jgi:hypothetical protein
LTRFIFFSSTFFIITKPCVELEINKAFQLRRKKGRRLVMGSLGREASKKMAMWLYPKVSGFNPSERWGHSACYSHGVVYVFGVCLIF